MTDAPKEGDVWSYPYLWARQSGRGETEGRKPRPVAVAVSIRRRDGQQGVVLLAITSQQPGLDRKAVAVPETERQRAHLSEDKSLWIILDEHNTDTVERSYYLDRDSFVGSFGSRFLKQLQTAFLEALKERKSHRVRRDD